MKLLTGPQDHEGKQQPSVGAHESHSTVDGEERPKGIIRVKCCGGIEYSEDIANAIDYNVMDESFKKFHRDLINALKMSRK